MFYVLKLIYGTLADIYERNADARSKDLPLVYSPLPMLVVLAAYLLFVLHYGPKWMEKRKPFHLKFIMRIYNGIQVISNIMLLLFGIPNSYIRKDFSLTCQPIDSSNVEPWMMRLVYVTYGYYLTKYLDLFDTIFIVLRKKNQQVTFLHVYHHAGMVFGVYVHVSFMAGSHPTMLGLINLFVHTVMYSYYFLTSFRKINETLWWKRYITQLQLFQFGYLAIHFLISFLDKSCSFPSGVSLIGFMQNIFMFALFFEFYYRNYLKKSKQPPQKNSTHHQ